MYKICLLSVLLSLCFNLIFVFLSPTSGEDTLQLHSPLHLKTLPQPEPYDAIVIKYDTHEPEDTGSQSDLIRAAKECENLKDLSTCNDQNDNPYINYFMSEQFKNSTLLGSTLEQFSDGATPVYLHFNLAFESSDFSNEIDFYFNASNGEINPLNIDELDTLSLISVSWHFRNIFNVHINVEHPQALKSGWNSIEPCGTSLNPTRMNISGFYIIKFLGIDHGAYVYQARLVPVDPERASKSIISVSTQVDNLRC